MTIYESISAVMADVGAIGKNTRNGTNITEPESIKTKYVEYVNVNGVNNKEVGRRLYINRSVPFKAMI